MRRRSFSSLILMGFVFALYFLGNAAVSLACWVFLCLLSQFELYKMLSKAGQKGSLLLILPSSLFLLLYPYVKKPILPILSEALLVLPPLYFSLWLLYQVSQKKIESIKITMPSLMNLSLIPLLGYFWVRLWTIWVDGYGVYRASMLIFWLIVSTKATDVGGFLVGQRIGRHKLMPSVSPNKSIEGGIGGTLLSIGLGWELTMILPAPFSRVFEGQALWMLLICIPPVAIFSDLVESAVKRLCKVKDSGSMIPGIGGAYDFIDSLLWVGPVAYFIFAKGPV